MSKVKIWVEAVRLRTLPVSASGVIIAIGLAAWQGEFRLLPSVLCLLFALLSQTVSNLANEYYDYLRGADKVGRDGPRRGVTEGDINPATLNRVTFITLIAAMAVGCCLLPFAPEGKWWLLIAVGVLVAMFALAYSAGPYPLSYHALGEPAVFIFYGLVPVNFTYYVVVGVFDPFAVMVSIAIGLMGVNVLLVNNYRDVDDDREAGKRTIAVVLGPNPLLLGYFFNGFLAIAILSALWVKVFLTMSWFILLVPLAYLVLHVITWVRMSRAQGSALNGVLAATARNMLLFSVALAIALAVS